jgi:hypothetical protein
MSRRIALLLIIGAVSSAALAQTSAITAPDRVTAGSTFSIQTTGTGNATLYFIGLSQVLKRDIRLGEPVNFPTDTLNNAGHYLIVIEGASSTENSAFDVVPADRPAAMSFLAKPSRLPVGMQDGITGAVYIFDAYQNLITQPRPVSFELSTTQGAVQASKVMSHYGAAWIAMNSSAKQGTAKLVAHADGVSNTRIIEQVPGDPCSLRFSARQSGQKLVLETDPVRDCSGNSVSDGTIVTFTETYNGSQSTVDVPIKRGIARVEMPTYNGAKISVASGVVMGNEVRWGK